MSNLITVVDKNNNVIGEASLDDAERKGLWHRIVIVYISNSQNKIYIQKRSSKVKSSPNLWDHSAAGHVDANETPINAAKRELKEELGINSDRLRYISTYKTQRKSNDRIINRYWYLYSLTYDGRINLQESEVAAGKFVDINWLQKDLEQNPEIYTHALKKSLQIYLKNKRSS